jgi:hypothetical protein
MFSIWAVKYSKNCGYLYLYHTGRGDLIFIAEACLNNMKNAVTTAKKRQCITITKKCWLMIHMEIMSVCSENSAKPINTLCRQNAELLELKSGKIKGSESSKYENGRLPRYCTR